MRKILFIRPEYGLYKHFHPRFSNKVFTEFETLNIYINFECRAKAIKIEYESGANGVVYVSH